MCRVDGKDPKMMTLLKEGLSNADHDKLMSGKSLSMSSISKMLQRPEIREMMWERIGLPKDLEIPNLTDDYHFYGNLSEVVHGPQGSFVYLSDDASEVETRFWQAVCDKFGKTLDMFDRKKVESGKKVLYAKRHPGKM
ncbi:hypothetical protein GUITHDRAFT_155858 [Guillardia theta CCMP2712]|uniref:Uncharacterized protein n=1 Tax=Guillardia theta (strain CCMP2712) TaxID=905079 RepID=L1ICT9_GUITC|nr:hypothetical protein GUITHDRAFT_155858 [Guillardia theta CCMP2712]EKX34053.1 hypothetical protein GUITHDRAFT_155858 [Guillardia theta CCMP2712]|eukprot:XP_005821033.1 hypothetical protein GUITHDRAFT_155858 [Guillardia theta CCMP2712]